MNENYEAWVLVGKTGCGKSSIINLFSDKQAKTSNKSESCTMSADHYCHKKNNNIHLIDTRGMRDSKGYDDESSYRETLLQLYNNKINKVKLIWCISPECRDNIDLQNQAKFINSFGNNIWKSLIINVKEGDVDKTDDENGAIKAASNYCDNEITSTIPVLKYSCLDWYDQDTRDKKINKFHKYDKEARQKDFGAYYANEVADLIENKITKIIKESNQMHFIITTCKKCGCKGDKRLLPINCHDTCEDYHPKIDEPLIHNGKLIKQHKVNQISTRHDIKVGKKYRHTGSYTWHHHGSWKYSSTKNGWMAFGHMATFGIATGITALAKGNLSLGEWTCCGRTNTESPACHLGYTCCNKSDENSSCSSSNQQYWSCCNGDENSIGCQKYYPCCEYGNENTPGCIEIWSCCDVEKNKTIGCVYECCQQRAEDLPKGCKQRCNKCRREWKTEGCDKKYQHDCA